MCPPITCGIDEIGAFFTVEELIACLESIQNRSPEACLPRNVVAHINPYLQQPSNLSECLWYVAHLEDPKQTEVGFWKEKGHPCQVYLDSSIVGWRTTLEFYDGHFPNGNQTEWVMEEYSISPKGSCKEKVASSLCRVFTSEKEGENQLMDQYQANDDVRGENNRLSDEDNKPGNSLMCKLQAEIEEHQAMPADQGDNPLQPDYFANGDYLELLDLLDPHSSPSSSENSSCMSSSSDVYFDSVALLQELECEDEVCQKKPPTHKFSVSNPNEMGDSLAAEGSPISGDNKLKEPIKVEPGLTLKRAFRDKDHIPENAKKRLPPASDDAGASSSGQKSGDDKGKKAFPGKMIKKFFCFIAF